MKSCLRAALAITQSKAPVATSYHKYDWRVMFWVSKQMQPLLLLCPALLQWLNNLDLFYSQSCCLNSILQCCKIQQENLLGLETKSEDHPVDLDSDQFMLCLITSCCSWGLVLAQLMTFFWDLREVLHKCWWLNNRNCQAMAEKRYMWPLFWVIA